MSLMFRVHLQWAVFTCVFAQTHIVVPYLRRPFFAPLAASTATARPWTIGNYRFPYLLSKALELCSELKSLGAAFLSAKEKQDGEALALLRQKQDVAI
jgi:hypothetical protein